MSKTNRSELVSLALVVGMLVVGCAVYGLLWVVAGVGCAVGAVGAVGASHPALALLVTVALTLGAYLALEYRSRRQLPMAWPVLGAADLVQLPLAWPVLGLDHLVSMATLTAADLVTDADLVQQQEQTQQEQAQQEQATQQVEATQQEQPQQEQQQEQPQQEQATQPQQEQATQPEQEQLYVRLAYGRGYRRAMPQGEAPSTGLYCLNAGRWVRVREGRSSTVDFRGGKLIRLSA